MKLKIRARRRFGLESMRMTLALFCLISYALLEHASISIPLVSAIKNPLLYATGICLVPQLPMLWRYWKKKRYFYILVASLAMCCLLLVSAYVNRSPAVGTSPMRNTIRMILYLVELILVMIWVAETGRSRQVLDLLFYYVLVLTILTDLLLFTGLMQGWAGSKDAYLVGTKFTVSYFHMNLLTLWFLRVQKRFYSDKKAKRVILWGTPVVVLVTVYINCITGILGCLLLLVLFLLLNTRFQKKIMRLNSPVLLVLCLAVSLVFPFVANWFTSIPAVSYLVQEVFGRDVSLTGRLDIFESFGREMQGHWMWGYGFGNSNAAAVKLFGYANAQNALLHWVLQVGVPITLLLVLLMILIFRQLNKVRDRMRVMPFVVLIYVYIILGFIEITFSMSFLLWLAMIFMLCNEKPECAAPASQKT